MKDGWVGGCIDGCMDPPTHAPTPQPIQCLTNEGIGPYVDILRHRVEGRDQ